MIFKVPSNPNHSDSMIHGRQQKRMWKAVLLQWPRQIFVVYQAYGEARGIPFPLWRAAHLDSLKIIGLSPLGAAESLLPRLDSSIWFSQGKCDGEVLKSLLIWTSLMPEETMLKFGNNLTLPPSSQQKQSWSVGFSRD